MGNEVESTLNNKYLYFVICHLWMEKLFYLIVIVIIRDSRRIKIGGRTTSAPQRRTMTRTVARRSSLVSISPGREPIASLACPSSHLFDLWRPVASADDYNRVFIRLDEGNSQDSSQNYDEGDEDDSSDEEDDGPTKYINASHISVRLFIFHVFFFFPPLMVLNWS